LYSLQIPPPPVTLHHEEMLKNEAGKFYKLVRMQSSSDIDRTVHWG